MGSTDFVCVGHKQASQRGARSGQIKCSSARECAPYSHLVGVPSAHMKQLEHVILRREITIFDPLDGCTRQLSKLEKIVGWAIAERTFNMDAGIQLAINEIAAGAQRRRASVTSGLAGLVRGRVIHRARGGPHDTHIYRFNQVLIDASEKSRPYFGPQINLAAALIPPPENAKICNVEGLETRANPQHLVNSDAQKLDAQKLGGIYKCHTPPKSGGVWLGVKEKREGDLSDLSPKKFDPEKNLEAKTFFGWLNKNGIEQIFINGMPRKKNGQRGAPIGKIFRFGRPYPTNEALEIFWAFSQKLVSAKKFRVDLHIRAAEAPGGLSNLLLVDDLSEAGVTALKEIWMGFGVILETSDHNYQALLVSQQLLTRQERLTIQQKLCGLVGGDVGAVSSTQFHRFPGSPNFKTEPSFICRVSEYFEGEGPGLELAQQPSISAPQPVAGTPKKIEIKPVGEDNSRSAIIWAMSSLRKGLSHTQVLAGLGGRWLSHHDPKDWPQRTLNKALFYLASRPPGKGQ